MRARAHFALLALAIVGAACRPTGAARLEGKWKGIRAEGVAAEAQATANAFAAQMELEVKGENISVATVSGKHESKFRVVREDKSTLVIVTEKDGPDDKQTFTFVDDRTVKWQVLEGKTITFARK
jgi:hypothetical protein